MMEESIPVRLQVGLLGVVVEISMWRYKFISFDNNALLGFIVFVFR